MTCAAGDIHRLHARGELRGKVAAGRMIYELKLNDDSDLDVSARRIHFVRSGGVARGAYSAQRIDFIFSDDDFLATLNVRTHGPILAPNY